MNQIYSFIERPNGKIEICETYLNAKGDIIFAVPVNMVVSNTAREETLRIIPYSLIEGNFFKEVEERKYVKL